MEQAYTLDECAQRLKTAHERQNMLTLRRICREAGIAAVILELRAYCLAAEMEMSDEDWQEKDACGATANALESWMLK